jgi:hypothetical protein
MVARRTQSSPEGPNCIYRGIPEGLVMPIYIAGGGNSGMKNESGFFKSAGADCHVMRRRPQEARLGCRCCLHQEADRKAHQGNRA